MKRPRAALLPVLLLTALLPRGGATAKQREVQTRVTVFLVPAKGYEQKSVARVSRALVRAIDRHPGIDVEDPDKLLVQYSGEAPREQINAATKALEQGIAQLKQGRPGEAIPTLEGATLALEGVLAFTKKRYLARAMLALAVARAEARQPRAALETMVALMTWRPRLIYDSATFDPQHMALMERAKAIVKRKRRGSAELKTDPPGAKAYVDGRFMGVTPTVVFGLKAGDHYATFKRTGFIKAARKITVSGRRQLSYSATMKRSEKYLLLKQSLAKARKGLGKARANEAMQDLRIFLYVDQVVFATIGYGGPGKLHIQAYLYDLRSKLRLKQVARTIEQRSLKGINALARNLYVDVRLDGTVAAPPDAPPPPPPKRTPFYAAWWFWTAVGAAVATAIVVPIYAWPDSDTPPPGNAPVLIKN